MDEVPAGIADFVFRLRESVPSPERLNTPPGSVGGNSIPFEEIPDVVRAWATGEDELRSIGGGGGESCPSHISISSDDDNEGGTLSVAESITDSAAEVIYVSSASRASNGISGKSTIPWVHLPSVHCPPEVIYVASLNSSEAHHQDHERCPSLVADHALLTAA